MKLPSIHQMPLIRFLIPMIVGILIYVQWPQIWIAAILLITSFICFLIYYTWRRKQISIQFKLFFWFGVILNMILSGFLFTYFQDGKAKFDFPKEEMFYRAEVISIPEVKERSIHCQLEIEHSDDSYRLSKKQIIAYFQKSSGSNLLRQGDYVVINAAPKQLINTNRPGNFDYATYLHRQGFSATTYIDSLHWTKLSKGRSFHLIYYANDLREKILEIFRSFHFKENEFALLSGITIGYKDALSLEQKNNFSAVGLSHLMAVSGMQTAMVFAMLWFLLGFIPKNSKYYRLKFLVVILGLWVFTYVTGLSASVVRASIMLTVLMIGGLFDRPTETLNSLAFSAFCILVYNPYTLFDIGFQLSYLAVIAIILAQNLFQNELESMKKVPGYFAELSIMTIAAQIGTSPLSIFYFHQFPLLFLLVNLIVLPFNALLVYLASAASVLVALHLPLMGTDKVLHWLLWSLDYVTRFFAQFSFSQIKELNPSATQVLLIYAIVGTTVVFLYKRRFCFIIYALLILVTLEGSRLYEKSRELKSNQLIVYDQFGENIVEHQYNGERILSKSTDQAFVFCGKRIVRLHDDIHRCSVKNRIKCDYLILTKGFKGEFAKIDELFEYQTLVIDAATSRYYSEKIEAESIARNRSFFNMAERGAFITSLN